MERRQIEAERVTQPVIDPVLALEERIAAFDAEPSAVEAALGIDLDLLHFIKTTAAITAAQHQEPPLPAVTPELADTVFSDSLVLRRLRERAAAITDGPLERDSQFWIATGQALTGPRKKPVPTEIQFLEAEEDGELPSTKPVRRGLFTSTGGLGTFGAWAAYLRLRPNSSLFPRPWTVWSLRVPYKTNIAEITSASEWVSFIEHNRLSAEGLIYPDWRAAAREWDGVHMTLAAIAATQGLRFELDNEETAPPYWDVESTVWLRWVFSESRCIGPLEA